MDDNLDEISQTGSNDDENSEPIETFDSQVTQRKDKKLNSGFIKFFSLLTKEEPDYIFKLIRKEKIGRNKKPTVFTIVELNDEVMQSNEIQEMCGGGTYVASINYTVKGKSKYHSETINLAGRPIPIDEIEINSRKKENESNNSFGYTDYAEAVKTGIGLVNQNGSSGGETLMIAMINMQQNQMQFFAKQKENDNDRRSQQMTQFVTIVVPLLTTLLTPVLKNVFATKKDDTEKFIDMIQLGRELGDSGGGNDNDSKGMFNKIAEIAGSFTKGVIGKKDSDNDPGQSELGEGEDEYDEEYELSDEELEGNKVLDDLVNKENFNSNQNQEVHTNTAPEVSENAETK